MLRLGEMVYRPAHEPGSLSHAAATLVRDALAHDDAEVSLRRRNAESMLEGAASSGGIEVVRAIARGQSGYLRAAVRNRHHRPIESRLGMATGYPLTLMEQAELQSRLWAGEREHPGARELRRTLVTLPTHRFLSKLEREILAEWVRGSAAIPGAIEHGNEPDGLTANRATSSPVHAAHVG
jgi:hypothetical protein